MLCTTATNTSNTIWFQHTEQSPDIVVLDRPTSQSSVHSASFSLSETRPDSHSCELPFTGADDQSQRQNKTHNRIHPWLQTAQRCQNSRRHSYSIIRVIRPATNFAIKINHFCQFKITDSSSIGLYSLRILRRTVQYNGALRSILVNEHQRQTYSNQN